MSFNIWEHLFLKGEYPSRDKLLYGLTLEQVNSIPTGVSHSIYEELWHLTTWQDTVISNVRDNVDSGKEGNKFPERTPTDLKEWEDLVNKFQSGVKKIMEYTAVSENLEKEIEPGITIHDDLCCLAVHNAVHFGKILAIRQALGAWPPEEKS